MRPNVLMIVFDAARSDAFEPYGAPAGASPAVAQLSARGAALDDVYATACWTVPSHASLFSGLLPRATGLARVPGPSGHACKPALDALEDRLLAPVMRRAGYRTGALSANVWLSSGSGFDNGFDAFEVLDSGRNAQIHGAGVRTRAGWALEALRARVDDGARQAEQILGRWIGGSDRRPFFWFVNLVECHSPYLPPRPWNDLGPLERLRAAADARRYQNLDAIWRACAGAFDVPDESIERMRHLYRRCVRYLDDWLAGLLERLDSAGILDDTLVLVTADHGENLGEGGLLAHALSLDNRLLRVPFVVAGPGAEDVRLRSLVELPRALAGAAGIADHPWTDELPDGASVAQLDPGIDASDSRTREAVKRWGLGEEAVRRLTAAQTAAVAGGLKLLQRDHVEFVYDLTADPLELAPIDPATRAAEVAELRRALAHPAVTASAQPSPGRPADQPSPEEVAEIEERMRMLGYL